MDRGFEAKQVFAGATLAAAVLVGGVACSDDAERAEHRSAASRQEAGGIAQEAVAVTDQDLWVADRNEFNCGGHLRNPEEPLNQTFMIDYLSGHPEMAEDHISWFDQSLGREAVDSLIAHGVRSGATPEDKQIPNQPRLTEFTKALRAVQLNATDVFANFTCNPEIHRAGGKPTIAIQAGSHVEGVLLDDAGLADFMSKVKMASDGLPPVVIKDITLPGDDKNVYHAIFLKAFGCGNPIKRLLPPTPGTPVTSSPPGRPPMSVTVPGPRDKTPRQRDHDARPQRGADGEGEEDMDPENDGEDGFGPGDTRHPVDQTTAPERTVPDSPNTTGPERIPAPSTPVTTEAQRPVDTAPPLGD